MSLWDLLDDDIQRYIRCFACITLARDRWRCYTTKVTEDILDLIVTTRENYNSNGPFTLGLVIFQGIVIDTERTLVELYGIEGFHTLNVINFIKNHYNPKIESWGIKTWMEWLNDLSYSLWENEWVGGQQSVIYNMIHSNSLEFYHNLYWYNPNMAIFPHIEHRFEIAFESEE